MLDRRNAPEGLGQKPVLFASLSYLFFGALCLLHILTTAITYAVGPAFIAVVTWYFIDFRRRRVPRTDGA